jgi:hypothetical protein
MLARGAFGAMSVSQVHLRAHEGLHEPTKRDASRERLY